VTSTVWVTCYLGINYRNTDRQTEDNRRNCRDIARSVAYLTDRSTRREIQQSSASALCETVLPRRMYRLEYKSPPAVTIRHLLIRFIHLHCGRNIAWHDIRSYSRCADAHVLRVLISARSKHNIDICCTSAVTYRHPFSCMSAINK